MQRVRQLREKSNSLGRETERVKLCFKTCTNVVKIDEISARIAGGSAKGVVIGEYEQN